MTAMANTSPWKRTEGSGWRTKSTPWLRVLDAEIAGIDGS
jgi:hypothetical protein